MIDMSASKMLRQSARVYLALGFVEKILGIDDLATLGDEAFDPGHLELPDRAAAVAERYNAVVCGGLARDLTARVVPVRIRIFDCRRDSLESFGKFAGLRVRINVCRARPDLFFEVVIPHPGARQPRVELADIIHEIENHLLRPIEVGDLIDLPDIQARMLCRRGRAIVLECFGVRPPGGNQTGKNAEQGGTGAGTGRVVFRRISGSLDSGNRDPDDQKDRAESRDRYHKAEPLSGPANNPPGNDPRQDDGGDRINNHPASDRGDAAFVNVGLLRAGIKTGSPPISDHPIAGRDRGRAPRGNTPTSTKPDGCVHPATFFGRI